MPLSKCICTRRHRGTNRCGQFSITGEYCMEEASSAARDEWPEVTVSEACCRSRSNTDLDSQSG